MSPAPVGLCDPRFEAVRAAFAENFTSLGEIGASVCITLEGHTVVDLWGGWRDAEHQRPWQADTLVNVFSVGKAVAAAAVARLVGQGRLAYDQPVAELWPEFAQGGKARITVRQLLSHQAGLPALRPLMAPGSVFEWDRMCTALAEQEPWWPPGTAHGYHVNTFGFLVGELVRRVTGTTLGALIRRDIAGPLGADLFIGLPDRELGRVADFVGVTTPPEVDRSTLTDDQLMELDAYFNPPEFSGFGVVNTRRWRQAELPSTNGHASARGIARFYDALVHGGHLDGTQVVDAGTLAEARQEQVYGEDRVLHRSSRFGIGFQLTQPERPLGPNEQTYGHFGAGGSLGFCDPDARLAFGYAMNAMGPRWQNPRNGALIEACYQCL